MQNALPISMNDLDVKLSDISNTVTTRIGFPDYSNAEKIIITRTDGYTVTKNGWMSVMCTGVGYLTVNGVMVAIANTEVNNWTYSQQTVFPVSKGDTVETTTTDLIDNVWFIPCK